METFTEMSLIFENCTSNCTDDNYDLYPHSYIIATIYLFTSILGILGNSLVIIGVIVTPKLQTPTNVLIVNLAIADLLTCMILPFQVYGILHEAIGAKFPRVCSFIGSVIYVTFTCSAVTLVLIAINRCYVITKNVHTTTGLNTHKKQLFLAVLSWILACLYNFIPIYGFHLTEFSYYPPYKQCFTSPTDTSDIYHNFLAILIGCHIVIMLGCYIRILVHVRQQRKLFHIFFGSSRSQQLEHRHHIKRLSQREVKVTKNLFSVVVAFICCTIPTAVAFVTPGVLLSGLYTTAVLYFNNCINPVFYAFRHPVFKKFFERLFMRVLKNFHCPKKLIPAGDSRYLAKTQEKSVTMACLYAVNVSQIVALQGVSDSIEMLDML